MGNRYGQNEFGVPRTGRSFSSPIILLEHGCKRDTLSSVLSSGICELCEVFMPLLVVSFLRQSLPSSPASPVPRRPAPMMSTRWGNGQNGHLGLGTLIP